MNSFFLMVDVQSVLFIYILAGFYCRKVSIFDDLTQQKLTEWTVRITLPCMVFASFDLEISQEALILGGTAITISTLTAIIALLLGKLLYRRFDQSKQSVMQYGTLVSNAGVAGLAIISGAYGKEGVFLASLFIIPTRILMWSAGISLFTTLDTRARIKKVLLNPAMVAVFLGLFRMGLSLQLPAFLDTALANIGATTAVLAMALVGAMLADVSFRDMFDAKAFYLSSVRQLALPLICLALCEALRVDPLTRAVAVILTGMPVGSTTAILASKYGADTQFASKCVFISTVTSLVTVPIIALFL